ncbi:MAG: lysylphosphatidylglycerol synthase transmembrane domain-containing protein [Candidatus Aminicenantes bacterium]|nr:lysylphosphatidylglycerol synthase transmembrane domain-containing protein [Candidatus Aminicenantes bacterium]
MLKRRTPIIILSFVLSGFLLYVLFRRIPPGDFFRMISSLYLPPLLAYMAISLTAAFLRAWRYRILLRPVPIGWPDIMIVTLVRNAFDDLLPARIGSLSYIYVLNDRLDKPFENAASSFVIAFIYDFLTLGPFVLLAVLAVGGGGAAGISTGALVAAAAVFFVFFVLIAWKIAFFVRLARNVAFALVKRTKWIRRPAVVRAFENLDQTVDILKRKQSPGVMPAVFLLSFFVRLGKYLSLFVLLFAVLRSQGVSWGDLSFWKTVLGLTGAEVTAALPVKGLAGFGTWETAWSAALQWMRFDPRLAILSGLGIHLVTNLFEYTLALSGLAVLAIRRKRDRISENS